MAGEVADYHKGEMDVHAQQATYRAFLTGSKWASLAVVVGVLLFTLEFCTDTGFVGSAFTAFVVMVLGIVVLRSRAPAH